MKNGVFLFIAFLLLFFLGQSKIISQETSLCKLIDKKINEVIKTFGKPLHQDSSNPSMECVFYQSKISRMTFIADKTGVYQIQADYFYGSKIDAFKAIDGFILECGEKGLAVDTLNAGDFKVNAPGVRMNFTLFENTYSKKYEVKFKADRSESK